MGDFNLPSQLVASFSSRSSIIAVLVAIAKDSGRAFIPHCYCLRLHLRRFFVIFFLRLN